MRPRADYVALHTINVDGVVGYREGDEMIADVVDNLGLEVGVDVQPLRDDVVPRPAGNATRAEWARYAIGQGLPAGDADDMTRDELRDRFPAADPDPDSAVPLADAPAPTAAGGPDNDEVPAGSVDDVVGWVGDDQTRAVMALQVERQRDRPRVGVIEPLERLVGE